MRLIDADAIRLPKGFFEKIDNVPKFYDWLDEQPTIEPKRGKWIKNEELSSNAEQEWTVNRMKVADKLIYLHEQIEAITDSFCDNCQEFDCAFCPYDYEDGEQDG